MDETIETLSKFLDEDDRRILRSVAKDEIALQVLKKVFEEPEKAEKYLVLIKDNPHATFLTAKLSEKIGRYLNSVDEEKCLNIFLAAMNYLKERKDRKIIEKIFSILKDAIDSRIANGKFETASKLVSSFLDLGFGSYVKKIVFRAIEVADAGDYSRAVRILDLLPQKEEVITTKSYILLEWGQKVSASNPEIGIEKIREALKLKDIPSAKLIIAEIYENIGNYSKAYEIYSSLKDQPNVGKRIARLLMEWGEEERDIKKLEEAKALVFDDPVMLEEIDRKISKIKS
ncbi:MAG: hypothetical protein QXQ83_02315 [Archaeoglobaceae archaeon]